MVHVRHPDRVNRVLVLACLKNIKIIFKFIFLILLLDGHKIYVDIFSLELVGTVTKNLFSTIT